MGAVFLFSCSLAIISSQGRRARVSSSSGGEMAGMNGDANAFSTTLAAASSLFTSAFRDLRSPSTVIGVARVPGGTPQKG